MASPATWIQKLIAKFSIPVEQSAKFGTYGEKDDGGVGHVGLINPHARAFNGMLKELADGDGFMIFGEAGEAPNIVAPSGAVTVDKDGVFSLEPGAVDGTAIADGSITNQKIANSTIQAGKLADTYIPATAGTVVPATGSAAVTATFTAALLQAIITNAAAKGLIVKAAASQSANLLEVQDSSGAVLFKIEANGETTMNTVNVTTMNGGTIVLGGSTRKRVSSLPTTGISAGDRYELELADGTSIEVERVGANWLTTQVYEVALGGIQTIVPTPSAGGYELMEFKAIHPLATANGAYIERVAYQAFGYGDTVTSDQDCNVRAFTAASANWLAIAAITPATGHDADGLLTGMGDGDTRTGEVVYEKTILAGTAKIGIGLLAGDDNTTGTGPAPVNTLLNATVFYRAIVV